MPRNVIQEIITDGFKMLNIDTDIRLTNLIAYSCNGLPYFAHLICEELGIYAVTSQVKRLEINNFFYLLDNIISKVTDIYTHYFESAARIHSGDFIYGYDEYNPGYPKIPVVHPIVLELIVMVFSITSSYDRKFICNTTNELIKKKEIKLPVNFNYVTEENVDIIFNELSVEGKLIIKENETYCFSDTYCKGYTFLKFALFCGDKILLRLIAQQGFST